jgi:competence protein ComFB
MSNVRLVADDLFNVSEAIVLEEIQRLLDEGHPDMPDSEIGLQDIAAIALNNMPPKYICSPLEKAAPSVQLQQEMEDLRQFARRQLLKAIRKVKAHPHDG